MYKYGVSFNCKTDSGAIGGGDEGCTSLDYVSNDLEKLKAVLIERDSGDSVKYEVITEGDEIGETVDIGNGEIVALLVDADDHTYVVAVIFEDPTMPEVV